MMKSASLRNDPMHPLRLKEKQRLQRAGFATPLALRVHRSLSWLIRASQEECDADARFIFLWIGFNAAYAGDVGRAIENERDYFREFFSTLVGFDAKHRIYDMVWTRFSQEIRLLLDNPYVFSPFWSHHNGLPGNADWEERLERSRVAIRNALATHDTARILSILFDRLYVLRNQLVHGGATWNSDVNRSQVKDGSTILGCLMPIFVDLMMDNTDHDWPMPHYPVIE
jgi:hypothetical protein